MKRITRLYRGVCRLAARVRYVRALRALYPIATLRAAWKRSGYVVEVLP